jgi:hypothetical protein
MKKSGKDGAEAMRTKDPNRPLWITIELAVFLFLFTAQYAYVSWTRIQYLTAFYNSSFWDSWIPVAWRNWAVWQAYSLPGEFVFWFWIGLLVKRLPVRIIGAIFSLYALGQAIANLLEFRRAMWSVPQMILSAGLTLGCIFGGILLGQALQRGVLLLRNHFSAAK